MFLGLVVTSCAFLLPAVLAKRRNKHAFSLACRVLTCTSLWFHTTYNTWSFLVDKAYAHAFTAFFGARSVLVATNRRSAPLLASCVLMLFPLHLYQNKVRQTNGRESQWWHVAFHLSSQACLAIHATYF